MKLKHRVRDSIVGTMRVNIDLQYVSEVNKSYNLDSNYV